MAMPRLGPDPFEQADQQSRLNYTAGLQNEQNAQNALMQMFQTEAARQQPWAQLPTDLARQNNQYRNMFNNAVMKDQYDQSSGNFKIPADAAALGSTLIGNLSKDLGISPGAAAGLVGNLASETGNFKHLQELEPVVPGSRGGAGWAMWTGPRRKDFERFTGGDTTSFDANYKYLVHDLQHNYPQVLARLKQTDNPLQAAQIIHDTYLIPGVKHQRKSAINAQKYYESFTTTMNKQVAGDAEYDRRQARKAGSGDGDSYSFSGKDFSLNDPA